MPTTQDQKKQGWTATGEGDENLNWSSRCTSQAPGMLYLCHRYVFPSCFFFLHLLTNIYRLPMPTTQAQ